MHSVLLVGAGKIGKTIAHLLSRYEEDYNLLVIDNDPKQLDALRGLPVTTNVVDIEDAELLCGYTRNQQAVISALNYHHTWRVANAARDCGASYFDLTEDIYATHDIRQLGTDTAAGQIMMPQCGLAPGFISIAAHDLAQRFDELHSLRLRVGALPKFPTNRLNYNLTWSTNGLINEYCNKCEVIRAGHPIDVQALTGIEHFSLDGVRYEAFNTSGGLGSLCFTLHEKVRDLDYKTIRYPGHRDYMQFLLDDLKLRDNKPRLQQLLEDAIPMTDEDVVITLCTATGLIDGKLVQKTDARKIYQQEVDHKTYSAIQITTASAVCAVVELHLEGKLPSTGFVAQEEVSLEQFLNNRFGKTFAVGD